MLTAPPFLAFEKSPRSRRSNVPGSQAGRDLPGRMFSVAEGCWRRRMVVGLRVDYTSALDRVEADSTTRFIRGPSLSI